jgi:hypothetical protein
VTPSPASSTPYEVLGVPSSDADDDLRRAYRRLARETHPDLGGTASAFRALQLAWEQIGTPEARASYDRRRPSTADASRASGSSSAPTWAPPTRETPRTDSKPRARVHGHPGGANRERYLELMREWVGRGVPLDDPYDERLVRTAPPEIRHVLADALAEEATVATVTELGIAFTIWSDVDAGAEGKLDHIVLGPAGLFAIQSSDWGGEVSLAKGELIGPGIPDHENPVRDLTRQARAVRRDTRVSFTHQLIVVPDDDFAAALEPAGRGRRGATYVLRRSLLPQVLRHGPDLSDRTTISDVFEIRDRLQQTVRFV